MKFRGTSAIRAAVDETWNMRKAGVEETIELGLSFNTRLVTVEKSRDDRAGHQMVFTLMPDLRPTRLVPFQRLTTKSRWTSESTHLGCFGSDADRKPWSVNELVEHDAVGGEHRKRAIRYGLQRLEQQALIERCDPPAEKRGGRGKPPVYYLAAGTDVPSSFMKKDVRSIPGKSVSIMQNPSAGTDLNDKTDLSIKEFLQYSGGSTPDKGLVGQK